jgi:hypothetical protein
MNNNEKQLINKTYFSQGKDLSYKALSKALPSKAIEGVLSSIYKSQEKINRYQKKIKKATLAANYLEKGSSALGIAGKAAGTVNSYYKISGLDTFETASRLADYSRKRQLSVRGKQVNKLLDRLDNKLENLVRFFRHIEDVKQQEARKEE